MEGEPDVRGGERRQAREHGVERGQGERVDGDAAEDVIHDRVPGDDRVVDAVTGDPAPPGHACDEVVDELDGDVFQALKVIGVLEGESDPRDNVRAVGILGVDRGGPLDDLPGPQVDKLGDDRARAQVDRQAVGLAPGIVRFDVEDLPIVVEDGGRRPSPGEDRAAELRQDRQGKAEPGRLQLRPEGVRHRSRRVQGWLFQDERELLHGRVDEDRRGDSRVEDGDLFEARPRERFHGEVAADFIAAGQPMVGAKLTVLEKGGLLRGGEGQGTVEDADGALAANPPPVAIETERDPSPGEDIGQDLAGPGPDLDPVGKDLDGEGCVGHRLLGFSNGIILIEIRFPGNLFLSSRPGCGRHGSSRPGKRGSPPGEARHRPRT
jgi:hypothetical protein